MTVAGHSGVQQSRLKPSAGKEGVAYIYRLVVVETRACSCSGSLQFSILAVGSLSAKQSLRALSIFGDDTA